MVGLLLTCEHASRALPAGVDLGVGEAVRGSHLAFDRGAGAIADRLHAVTGAPLHRGAFTRLLVDLNRRDSNPVVIAAETHGVVVPANVALDAAGLEARLDRWHRPWRAAVLADARRLVDAGSCLHLSLHSFDPHVDPANRPMDAGVLFDEARTPERENAAILRDGLVSAGFDARLNAPFQGTPEGTTSWLRAQLPAARYSGIELEASYAWVDDPTRVEAYVAAVAAAALRCS